MSHVYVMLTGLQQTALKTAAHRANSKKVNDPYAAHLAGKKLVAEKAVAHSGTRFVEERTLWFDDKISKTHHQNIVMLGAGMDTRAYRLDSLTDKCVYETDFAEVLAYKTDKLFELDPPPSPRCARYAQFDFDIYKDDLKFNDALYVAEGLLNYISPEGVHRFFRSLPLGCSVIFDTINNNVDLASAVLNEDIDTDLLWGVDNPRAYLEQFGYTHQETREYIADTAVRLPELQLFMVHAENNIAV